MNKQKTKGFLSVLAVIIILAAIITAVLVLLKPADYSKNGVETQATTVQIKRSSGNLEWYALYQVNGKNYATPINGDSSKFAQGGSIEIYYDTNDPDNIWLNNGSQNNNLIIGIIIGVASILAVIIIFVIISKNKSEPLKTSSVTYQHNSSHETSDNSTYNDDNNNDINKF